MNRCFATVVLSLFVSGLFFSSNSVWAARSFEAELRRADVLPAPSGNTPLSAHGSARFELLETLPGTFELAYQIELVGLDSFAYRFGQPPATATTDDDLAAIHMHVVTPVGSDNVGTKHVLNVLGAPLTGAGLQRPSDGQPMEDDLALVSYESSTLTTIYEGRWDAADVAQTASLPMAMGRSEPLADYLSHLQQGELFMMIHTTADTTGALGGSLVVVPEPSTGWLALIVTAGGTAWRRR